MPQMGVSVAEGTIVKWHKHPGDWVEADETVCDISTDKIDTELPSPAERPAGADPRRGERDRRRRNCAGARSTPAPQPGQAHVAEATVAPQTAVAEWRARPLACDLAGRAPRRGGARHRPVAGEGHGHRVVASARRTCLRSSTIARRAGEPRRRSTPSGTGTLHTESPLPAPDTEPVPAEPVRTATAIRSRRCAARSPST